MSRPGRKGTKNESVESKTFLRAIPSVPIYWRRGVSSSKLPPIQNVKTVVADHSVRDTSTKAAPFTPARKSHNPSAPTSTRKVSASFSTDCPLSGHPTIAYSTVTASTTLAHPGPLTSHPINRSSTLASPRRHRNMNSITTDKPLKTSLTCSNLPIPSPPKRSLTRTRINTRALSGHNEENIPPSLSVASTTATKQGTSEYPTQKFIPKPPSPKKKAKSRPDITRSRTFSVFSNLTASLSRTSFGQLTGNDSRRTSTSSKGTVRKDKTPYINPQSASSTSSQALPSPASHRQVYTAQSSAYWAGRFMALRDRLQSETLEPENMKVLLDEYAKHSMIPAEQPSMASSVTMSFIPAYEPTHSSTTSTSPRKPQQQLLQPKHRSWTKPAASKITHVKDGSISTPTSDAATLLDDDDFRTRRIFLELDALCATHEARYSLHKWQEKYARSTGTEHRKRSLSKAPSCF